MRLKLRDIRFIVPFTLTSFAKSGFQELREVTKEGYDFWEDVHISIISDAQLPQLPIDIHYLPDTTFFMNNKIHVMNSAGLDFNLKFKFYKEDRSSFDQAIKEKFLSWCN